MSPAPETHDILKKRSCSVQSLTVQRVSLVCVVYFLLFFSCSLLQASHVHRLSLAVVDGQCLVPELNVVSSN